MKPIRIGTRGSTLAVAQAGWVREKLEERYPGLKVEIITIKTSGDRFLDSSLTAIGGKGVFVKEIEEALLRREIDLAVHSMKDLPTEIAPGLTLAAVPEREDPRDALVTWDRKTLKELPSGAKVGTGSQRRRAQLLYHRPDLAVVPMRGNIDTRLKKLERGEVAALVMAVAGLKRIGHESRVSEYLSPQICLSAVGQGALGLQSREGEPVIGQVLFLHYPLTAFQVMAERSFLRRLGGGCQVPIGARAWTDDDQIRLMGVVCDADGLKLYRGEITGAADDAARLGQELAEKLLKDGAGEILMPKESLAHA